MTQHHPALAKQTRFNPLRTLTPTALSTALDQFETGWLRTAALIWQAMEQRDPVLCGAAGKRKRSVSRRPWEIITTEGMEENPKAEKQKEALEYLFNHLTARDAVAGDVRGGVSLLIKQMMDAIFKRRAVHEIVWKQNKTGLTCETVFVPLWFFEETTGTLRYTGPTWSANGQPLKAGEWMVTSGDGIMEAISVAYMFKKLSLEDWVNFSEKFGVPGIHGLTDAVKGSAEWDTFVSAVGDFANDWVCATNRSAEIKLVESSKTGDQPFEPMVERMERTMVALCRGADLGTLSSKDGAGASLQGDEANILEEDDCELISETIQHHLARPALEYLFGKGVEILAYFKLQPSATTDVAQERDTDTFLIKHGVRISTNDLAERYGRTQAEEGEELAGGKAESEKLKAEKELPPGSAPQASSSKPQAKGDGKDEPEIEPAANTVEHWETLLAQTLVEQFQNQAA